MTRALLKCAATAWWLSATLAAGGCGEDATPAGFAQLGPGSSLGELDERDAIVGQDTAVATDTAVGPGDTGPNPGDTGPNPDDTSVSDTSVVVPTDTAQPPADTVQPPTDTVQPPADTAQPPADTVQPGCQSVADCDQDVALAACQRVACVSGACAIVAEGDGAACDDGDACTTGDTCEGGVCGGAEVLCAPTAQCKAAACVDGGCVETPTSGAMCNDGDACTTGDVCVVGVCQGTPKPCDDGNACTADSCLDGVCKHEPIEGCGVVPECVGKGAGDACDDGDPNTFGDLCLLGVCRGFKPTRINASAVDSDGEGLVLTEIDRVGGAWWSVFWVSDEDYDFEWMLADVSNPAAFVVDDATDQNAPFTGLVSGFATDWDGRIWRRTNGGWTRSNPWDNAVGASGRGYGYALWVERDLLGQPQRLWVVGEDDEDDEPWIRACSRSLTGTVTCVAQTLDDLDPASIPRAVAGLTGFCPPGSDLIGLCDETLLVLGADAPSSGSAVYKDAFENLGGALPEWTAAYIPQGASSQYTRAAAGWGDGEFLIVGTSGFMRHRRPDGGWSGSLSNIKTGMSQRDFTGVWVGAGVIAVSAWRRVVNTVYLELWTCALNKDPEQGASWVVHDLGNAGYASAAGLYDVHGSDLGELRAVGAVRRDNLGPWLDGVILVRPGVLP